MAPRMVPKKEVTRKGNMGQDLNPSAKKMPYDHSLDSEDGETVGDQSSPVPYMNLNKSAQGKPAPKRKFFATENENVCLESENEFSNEMSGLLQGFGSAVNKTLQAKRQRLETMTQDCVRSTSHLVSEMNKAQYEECKKLQEEFKKQIYNFMQQGEQELEKGRETEEKIQKTLQQFVRHQQQMRIAHGQRMKALQQLCDHFFGGMDSITSKHGGQLENIQNELRSELTMLQKRILMDTQQQEMINVKKSLQSIFAMK